MTPADKQHAHDLLDHVPQDQFTTAVRFLEFLLVHPVDRALATAAEENEIIGSEEEKAVARSKEWFRTHNGYSLEQVAGELGFDIDEVRGDGEARELEAV